MREEKSRQSKEMIEIVRKWSSKYALRDVEQLEPEFETVKQKFSSRMLRITFICYNFSQDEGLANKMLLSMIPECSINELIVIFKKINLFNDDFIKYCRKYAKVKNLKPAIAAVFRKLRISCEEAHVYFFEDMENDERERSIKKLLTTVNTQEFKSTKDVILPIIDGNVVLLPPLTELGYKNLRKIGKLELLRNQFSYFHSSEIIRIEYLREAFEFYDVYNFLRFNQFIQDPSNLKVIEMLITEKLKRYSIDKDMLAVYCDLLYHSLIYRMCRSPNPKRRHLGVILLRMIFTYFPDMIEKRLMLDLIFDLSLDIRKQAETFRKLVDFSIDEQIDNLFVGESNIIGGASILLQDINPEILVSVLFKSIDSHRSMVFGVIYCLNYVKYTSNSLTSLILDLYNRYKYFERNVDFDMPEEYGWNTLRECCVYLRNVDRHDLLMSCLLLVDHFGLICAIKDLARPESLNISQLIVEGIEEIFRRDTKTRKSGGLSQYFVLLNRDNTSHDIIKKRLFECIGKMDGTHIVLKKADETVLFHTLNVFISLFDEEAEDYLFYLKLGFGCLDSKFFSVKNSGFVLLGSIFKKILISGKTFDSFFLSRSDVRKYVTQVLEKSIQNGNTYAIFFGLFVFKNTTILESDEKILISKCLDFGEFVSLMAQNILDGMIYDDEMDQPSHIEISPDQTDADIITELLIYTNRMNEGIKKIIHEIYGISDASFEYLLHQLVDVAKTRKCGDEVYKNLLKYHELALIEDKNTGVYNPDTDVHYILELLLNDQ